MQFLKRIVSSICFAVGYTVGAGLITMTNALNSGFEAAERRYAKFPCAPALDNRDQMTARLTFPRSRRLHGKLTFRAIYDTGLKITRGPLVVFSIPNDLGYPRIGLSVSRRVGSAPHRNLIKRRLRESFRAMQHDVPRGYDLVLVVRPHNPLGTAEYRLLLGELVERIHNAWLKKCAGS